MGLNGGAGIPVITATATGNPLTFETDMVKPLKSLVIPFTPIQAGSGDPSPTNVRPISGWTGVNIYNETAYNASAIPKLTINWQTEAGTIYGGTLTLNEDGSADIVANKAEVTYVGSASESWAKFGSGSATAFAMQHRLPNFINQDWAIIANYLKIIGRSAAWGNNDNWVSWANPNILVTGIKSITTVDAWKTYLAEHPLTVVYSLASPQIYHYDTIGQLVTFLGTNIIWTDTNGTNTATYLKHQS